MSAPRSDHCLGQLSSSFGGSPPSFRRTQSGSVPRIPSQIDVSSTRLTGTGRLWQTPPALADDAFVVVTDKPSFLGAIGRRATDSAVTQNPLQNMLDQMDLNARARQRQGPMTQGSMSAPLSPSSLTARAFSTWPQTDRQAIPPENIVYPERIAAGEFSEFDCPRSATNVAGLDTRTSIMIKDVPVSRVG